MRFLLVAAALLASSAASVVPSTSGPTYVFVFGDSYTSTNFDINGLQPNSTGPMGNTDLPSLGAKMPTWIDFLTTKYNTSTALIYNFAVGGAAIPDNYTYQIENLYQPKYTTTKFWEASNTLHISWIGINDCSGAWIEATDSVITTRMPIYAERLQTLYDTGARNFLIINVPPVDRSPFVIGSIFPAQTAAGYNGYVALFNTMLRDIVKNFQETHPDAKMILYDVNTFFNKVLDNPAAYGFKNNSCGDEEGCIWDGGFHVLSPVHDIIAKDVAKELRKFKWSD